MKRNSGMRKRMTALLITALLAGTFGGLPGSSALARAFAQTAAGSRSAASGGSDESTASASDTADSGSVCESGGSDTDDDEDCAAWDEELADDLATDSNASLSTASASNAEVVESFDFEETLIITAATASQLASAAAASASTADSDSLWDDWTGDTGFLGSGTEDDPYLITGIARLMGLSQRVAEGEDFAGEYFELTADIDLSGLDMNDGNWNPIGWYETASEMTGDVSHPFSGCFDGGGHEITGLLIASDTLSIRNAGLFGVIDGGTVENLTVEAEEVAGEDSLGVLAGQILGESVIYNVTVSGYVNGTGDIGGIAGTVEGDASANTNGYVNDEAALIENCSADGIILNSTGSSSYVGGIAGSLQKAYLVDSTVTTQDGDSGRIQGKGCVGGIAGRQYLSSIYNSYVTGGTIGGNGSKAVGGIVGKYESGNLVLARMAADIASTNQGSSAHEGSFVGTRDSSSTFTYGTGQTDRFSWLFADTSSKAKNVFGSSIDGDNDFDEDAHVGYWTDSQRCYVLVYGKKETDGGDTYFYEELEDGVEYIATMKLGREFTADGYWYGLKFRLDHFAPGYMGEPIRGYLVYIQRIDAQNANGTIDTDVAVLTALPSTGSSYYKTIDHDNPAAVMAGAVVTAATAAKNSDDDYYQMVTDESEAGGVKPPCYRDEDGEMVPMTFVGTGSYSFVMPECDTLLTVEYVKVTTQVSVEPTEIVYTVTHLRSGNRKDPDIVTEVLSTDGTLTARYIDGQLDEGVEVQTVAIHAEVNEAGDSVDQTVRWAVDDTELIENETGTDYTTKDAQILPNLDAAFFVENLESLVQAQADGGYREAIPETTFTANAVVTAYSNPDTSADNVSAYANCRVTVNYTITDETTLRVEEVALSETEIAFTITRTLTGTFADYTETVTCSEPVVLSASVLPAGADVQTVSWDDEENGRYVALVPSGTDSQECTVSAVYDAEGLANPAWIQNVINADRAAKEADSSVIVSGSASVTETVTVTSADQTYGNITDTCLVTLYFETVDETTKAVKKKSSGGGGGSGGSGGTSSTGTVVAAGTGGPSGLPSYVVSGTWNRDRLGRWTFSDGTRAYAGEWAAIYNPYANTELGQSDYDWFYFDADGFLVTGWFTDTDGSVYYLHPYADGVQGRMYTGRNIIDGEEYFFNEESDGKLGALVEQADSQSASPQAAGSVTVESDEGEPAAEETA